MRDSRRRTPDLPERDHRLPGAKGKLRTREPRFESAPGVKQRFYSTDASFVLQPPGPVATSTTVVVVLACSIRRPRTGSSYTRRPGWRDGRMAMDDSRVHIRQLVRCRRNGAGSRASISTARERFWPTRSAGGYPRPAVGHPLADRTGLFRHLDVAPTKSKLTSAAETTGTADVQEIGRDSCCRRRFGR